jgi:hypothetical protein
VRHGRDQSLVRRLQLTSQEALDHGQREAPLLELSDAAKPLQVAVSVPGDATLPPWSLQQALALVEPDRVHGHARRARQLFDPVLHEYLL